MSWLVVLGWLRKVPWRVWAALALAVAVWWTVDAYGDRRATEAAATVQARWDAQEDAYARQRAEATIAARKVEQRHRAEYRAIAERFLKEQADADKDHANTLARLRAGQLRVRERFTCPSVPGAAGDPGRADAADQRGLGTEDAAALIGIAAEGDRAIRRLRALQEAVRAGER